MPKRIAGIARDLSLILGNTLLLICLLEGGFSLLYLLQDRFSGDNLSTTDYHVSADAYGGDASWVNDYWQEFAASKGVEWSPYVYWRRKPYRGRQINIGSDGLRVTTDTAARQTGSNEPVKIFMFGGSTMWGTGARDAFTIPSIVARELRKEGVVAEVRNFGEAGYVSTQEVIALMRLLQQGDVPDLAIFYDGINDTYSAYQQHVAGVPQNEFNRVKEFNLTNPDSVNERRALALQDVSARLATMRFLRGLHWRFRVRNTDEAALNPFIVVDNTSLDSDALAQEVIERYIGNIELVEALSEHYAFKCVFYWQPTIFEKLSLTDYEKAEREKYELEPFFHKTYATLAKNEVVGKSGDDFRNLSAIFSQVKEPIFVDWSHLGEAGNEVIAKSMVNDALARIVSSPAREDEEAEVQ